MYKKRCRGNESNEDPEKEGLKEEDPEKEGLKEDVYRGNLQYI